VSSSSPAPQEEQVKGGRYSLLRQLGEGTQGETFEARDNGHAPPPAARGKKPLQQQWNQYVATARGNETKERVPEDPRGLVAIKRFRVSKAKAWKDVELAEREARTLASLNHPHLPRYIEHFEEEGALYLVMEKVEGENLASLRAREGSLDHAEVTRMLEDIAEALRYLHGRAPAIVHRDIKPGNVIRRPDGSYALVDFGAVRDRLKPTGGSTVVGTFGYMPPEQFQGRASPKSDLYGLGATAMTMLTGIEPEELPHEGLGIDVRRALPTSTPAHLVRALTAMLQPDPDRRVGSIDEVLGLLRHHKATSHGPPRPPVALSELPRTLSRKERRALKDQAEHTRRLEKQRRRALAHARRPPFVARFFAKLGLLIAWTAVWATVGFLVPLLLLLLSLLFGKALRRAASACVVAARRSQGALGRASAWLSGERREDIEGVVSPLFKPLSSSVLEATAPPVEGVVSPLFKPLSSSVLEVTAPPVEGVASPELEAPRVRVGAVIDARGLEVDILVDDRTELVDDAEQRRRQ